MEAFLTSTLLVAVAEIGDKTQLATVALAARFDNLAAVVLGTTLGMMLADVPTVMLGEKLATRLPMKAMRLAAAGLFMLTGVLTLLGWPTWPAAEYSGHNSMQKNCVEITQHD